MTATAAQPRPLPSAPYQPAGAPTDTSHPRDLRLITPDGIALSIYDSRPAAPDHTVLFLHGLCLSRATWTHQVARVRDDYGASVRIIAYDHRGHGSSANAPISTYTIEQLADDLAYLLTALEVHGPLTLVTHSMGAMAALAYLGRPAPQRPVDPTGLVLVATAAGKLSQHGFVRCWERLRNSLWAKGGNDRATPIRAASIVSAGQRKLLRRDGELNCERGQALGFVELKRLRRREYGSATVIRGRSREPVHALY